MRAKLLLVIAISFISGSAAAQDYVQQQNTSAGLIRVILRPEGPVQRSNVPGGRPTIVGVPYFDMMSGVIGNALYPTPGVKVISPTHLPLPEASFDSPIAEDFTSTLAAVCAAGKLDYAVFGTQEQMTGPTSPGFGFGLGFNFGVVQKARTTLVFKLRVYDCRSKAVVWNQLVGIEHDGALLSQAISGHLTFYAGDGPSAAATLIAQKLVSDLGW